MKLILFQVFSTNMFEVAPLFRSFKEIGLPNLKLLVCRFESSELRLPKDAVGYG